MPNRIVSRSAFALAATLVLSTAAQAQLFRAYLSVDGSDANPCTLPAPCRLLPAALNAIASGGEVWMLDSANYNTGPVTVGKSATILAVPGALGSVVALGGPALQVTASGLDVVLRNLMIVPFPGGAGTHGVLVTGASALAIEGSRIANLAGDGVQVSGEGTVKVTNTIIRGSGGYAVWLRNGATGVISASHMLDNSLGGVQAVGTTVSETTATVTDSVISGGVEAVWARVMVPGAVARAFVTRCTVEGVLVALDSSTEGAGVAVVSASGNTIVRSSWGWFQSGSGSSIESTGTNHFANTTANYGVLTPTPLQ